ncbi:MAG: transglutaminase family protein [Gammaproteobacteria bacterium]|nr:transglutaminase family protein [Gammaproteobacteria bacterium]
MNTDLQPYLEASEYIDWQQPDVMTLASQLSADTRSESELVNNCFEWVRDNIKHSWDYKINPVTCKASDVLKHMTGYCYAKSHLLAALLRANKIPAGLCYQRLSINEDGAPYSLHGLNAVYLHDFGWYRLDPRGNKQGVDAQFTPPYEQLAFPVSEPNERDLPEIWRKPLDCITQLLSTCQTVEDVIKNLPDIEVIKA